MKVSTSVWSRSINRLFGSSQSTASRDKKHRRSTARKLVMESLERREVFSTDLLSVLSFGNATGNTEANNVAVDTAGNSYTTGYFSGTVDFDPSNTHPGNTDILTSRGVQDAYVAKYDASGNSLIWAIRMGGDSTVSYSTSGYYAYDLGSKVKLDSTGNVYVVGNYAGSSDFGTTINGTPITLTTAGDQDGFVVKLNSAGNVQWANRWGSTGNQVGTSVGIDGSGNVYVQGLRQDATNAKKGIDILKFNSTGSQVWSKSIDTNIANFGDMAVDSSGNVFAVADFNGTADFDPGPQTRRYSAGSFSKESGFVLKLTAQGNFGWVSIFRGGLASYSEAISVVLDGSGSNVVVGGYFAGPVDFDPGSGVKTLSNNGEYSAYITKLNSNNGSLVWAKSLTATSTSGGAGVKGLAIGPNDSIYVSGYYKGTVDFDPSSTSTYSRTGYMISPTVGSIDAFILNLDSSGNFGWVETFGGSGVQYANGIAVDASGTIYVSGTFVGTVDFDPGLGTENRSSSGALRSGFIARFRRS